MNYIGLEFDFWNKKTNSYLWKSVIAKFCLLWRPTLVDTRLVIYFDENVRLVFRSSKDEIDTSTPRRTRPAFSRCPSHWRDFDKIQLHVKWIYIFSYICPITKWFCSLQGNTAGLEWAKLLCDWSSFLSLPKDKFQRITILIEFSLVQRTQGHVWRLSFERCTSWLNWGWPVASCSVWWWRHNYLRETLWDPAIVTGVKMIDSTRWVTISFMMIFTTGHIKLVNLE